MLRQRYLARVPSRERERHATMDARTYFLILREHCHTRGKAARVVTLPTPELWRTVLPGHNSIVTASAFNDSALTVER